MNSMQERNYANTRSSLRGSVATNQQFKNCKELKDSEGLEMGSNKNMVTDCLLAKVNFPLYAAEMLTSR